MYSHLHLPKGAFLAQSQRSDIEELLNWLKLKLSATVNLCTVTFIDTSSSSRSLFKLG